MQYKNLSFDDKVSILSELEELQHEGKIKNFSVSHNKVNLNDELECYTKYEKLTQRLDELY